MDEGSTLSWLREMAAVVALQSSEGSAHEVIGMPVLSIGSGGLTAVHNGLETADDFEGSFLGPEHLHAVALGHLAQMKMVQKEQFHLTFMHRTHILQLMNSEMKILKTESLLLQV